MKISCSKFNEVSLLEIEEFVKSKSQIRYSEWRDNNVFVGCLLIDGICYSMKAGDEVCINNVWLPLASGNIDYFDCEIIIN